MQAKDPLENLIYDESGRHFIPRAVDYLTGNWPEISAYLQDPAYTTAGISSAALFGTCLIGGTLGAAKLQSMAREYLHSRPGSVRIGRRAESDLDFFLAPWMQSRAADRFYHMEIVGPTGQAKTSLMEYLAYQDLRDGMTVVIVETVGDFANKMIRHADTLGKPKFVLDPSRADTIKWNPLSGDKTRIAEQIADAVVNMDNSKESFFQEFGSVVLRRMFYVAEAYATSKGLQPTIRLLRNLLSSPKHLDDALGIDRTTERRKNNKDKRASEDTLTIAVEGLDADTRFWVEEQWLGLWDDTMRTRFTAGLQSVIDTLLAHPEIADAFSPGPGEEQLDIAAALDTPGSLVVLRIDSARYARATNAAASLLLQRLQQAAETRPDYTAPPAILYLDEIHNLMGFHNESIAQNYARWLTLVRKKMVGVVHAYQSYGLIPERLNRVLQTNARTKLVSGGLGYEDRHQARMTFGQTRKTERSTRRTHRIFSWAPPTVSEGEKETEQPYLDDEELRTLRRGYWYYQETRDGHELPPVKIHAGRAPKHRFQKVANVFIGGPYAGEDVTPGDPSSSGKGAA
jgi:hypothetical protein